MRILVGMLVDFFFTWIILPVEVVKLEVIRVTCDIVTTAAASGEELGKTSD